MARIRSTDTRAELILHALLLKWLPELTVVRYSADIMGKPDFYIPELSLAIFVDGCFFHGCPVHYRPPADNADFWKAKIDRNRARDIEVNRSLRTSAIRVMRIWEHELRGKQPVGESRIRRRILRAVRAVGRAEDSAVERADGTE